MRKNTKIRVVPAFASRARGDPSALALADPTYRGQRAAGAGRAEPGAAEEAGRLDAATLQGRGTQCHA